MAKLDWLKEEINTDRVFLEKFILVAVAIVTGIVTIIYQVISNKVELYMLLIAVVGLIALSINISLIIRIKEKLDKKSKELKDV